MGGHGGWGGGPHLLLVQHLLLELLHDLALLVDLIVLGGGQEVSPSSAGAGWMGSPPPTRQGPPSPLRQRLSSASSFPMVSFSALFFSFSFSYFFFHCSAVSSRFTDAVFLIGHPDTPRPLPYLCPNMRVDLVSASL
uniref:Uncharacterized protein n=1 Tax=Aquila chrysaetos chrysaetos TaxID=223781 RepID=A0A663FGG3_AQUCH